MEGDDSLALPPLLTLPPACSDCAQCTSLFTFFHLLDILALLSLTVPPTITLPSSSQYSKSSKAVFPSISIIDIPIHGWQNHGTTGAPNQDGRHLTLPAKLPLPRPEVPTLDQFRIKRKPTMDVARDIPALSIVAVPEAKTNEARAHQR